MKEPIQGLWIGRELSLMEQLSIKSFLAHGHSYHLYTYGKIKNIPKGTIIKDGREILPKSKIFKYSNGPARGGYGGFSDLFRLKLLLDKGGIWADLDVICLKSFDFASNCIFSSERSPSHETKIGTCIIKVPPNNAAIAACYWEATSIKTKDLEYGQIGPSLLSKNIQRFNLEHFVVPPKVFCPVNYWNFARIINPDFKFRIPKETYAIHLWNEKWRQERKNWREETPIEKAAYKFSAKLKEYSTSYLHLIDSVKNISPFLRLGITFKERIFLKGVPDKNRIYSGKTLYGKLQRMYL